MTGAGVSPGPGWTSGDEAAAAKHPDPTKDLSSQPATETRGNLELRFSRPDALKGQVLRASF